MFQFSRALHPFSSSPSNRFKYVQYLLCLYFLLSSTFYPLRFFLQNHRHLANTSQLLTSLRPQSFIWTILHCLYITAYLLIKLEGEYLWLCIQRNCFVSIVFHSYHYWLHRAAFSRNKSQVSRLTQTFLLSSLITSYFELYTVSKKKR